MTSSIHLWLGGRVVYSSVLLASNRFRKVSGKEKKKEKKKEMYTSFILYIVVRMLTYIMLYMLFLQQKHDTSDLESDRHFFKETF